MWECQRLLGRKGFVRGAGTGELLGVDLEGQGWVNYAIQNTFPLPLILPATLPAVDILSPHLDLLNIQLFFKCRLKCES